MTANPLARSLATFEREDGKAEVNSVGYNRWAETTFTTRQALNGPNEYRIDTYGPDGKPTSDGDGYISEPDDPFKVSEVDPTALSHIIAAVREKQPEAQLIAAVFNVAPFKVQAVWRVQIGSPNAGSAIIYQANADGAGLCHGTDYAQDALVHAPGIPACAQNPFIFG